MPYFRFVESARRFVPNFRPRVDVQIFGMICIRPTAPTFDRAVDLNASFSVIITPSTRAGGIFRVYASRTATSASDRARSGSTRPVRTRSIANESRSWKNCGELRATSVGDDAHGVRESALVESTDLVVSSACAVANSARATTDSSLESMYRCAAICAATGSPRRPERTAELDADRDRRDQSGGKRNLQPYVLHRADNGLREGEVEVGYAPWGRTPAPRDTHLVVHPDRPRVPIRTTAATAFYSVFSTVRIARGPGEGN